MVGDRSDTLVSDAPRVRGSPQEGPRKGPRGRFICVFTCPGPPGRPQEVPGDPPGRPRMQIVCVPGPDHACFTSRRRPRGSMGPVHTCSYVSEEPGARPRGPKCQQVGTNGNGRERTKTNGKRTKTNVLARKVGLHGGGPPDGVGPTAWCPLTSRGRRISIYIYIYI